MHQALAREPAAMPYQCGGREAKPRRPPRACRTGGRCVLFAELGRSESIGRAAYCRFLLNGIQSQGYTSAEACLKGEAPSRACVIWVDAEDVVLLNTVR